METALEAIFLGDRAQLEALLDEDPELVRRCVDADTGPYCGYFHRATLLHHVAGNPLIRPLPANVPALAALIFGPTITKLAG